MSNNQSIKVAKKAEETARKEQLNIVSKNFKEVSLSKFPDIDNSKHFKEINLESMCYQHNYSMEDVDGSTIDMNWLMLPESMYPKPVVRQVVPKEVSDKIDNLFKVNAKLHRSYFMLKLYLNGFTQMEICDYYSADKKNVSTSINKAKQLILDNLTEEELSKCYWWLKVDRPKVTVTPTYVYPVEVKPQPKQKHWLDELFKAPTRK
ncbi:hypothetical protein P2R12_06140 [Cytobacillus oceanisediminis]|uniref:hypothetical protein n=1 Tax=Cytobacillus oceanisediminis TaxID=665099 RepID=UPI0023DC9BB0|nr:hypothetical protein [Cytobacillus oceanisediminis]MDF2036573.1 hypothetical protein [Cytobacillus oceanisediminis]